MTDHRGVVGVSNAKTASRSALSGAEVKPTVGANRTSGGPLKALLHANKTGLGRSTVSKIGQVQFGPTGGAK